MAETAPAALMAVVVAVSMAAWGIRDTHAEESGSAQSDYTCAYTNPNPANFSRTLSIGQTEAFTVANAFSWNVNNPSVLALTSSMGSINASVTAKKLGVATVAAASTSGQVILRSYQVVDNDNITGYTIAGGIEGSLAEAGDTLTIPITTEPAGSADRIIWQSLNESVASVAPGGIVTAVAESGAAIIQGTFTDPWGVDHTIPYMVLVGDLKGAVKTPADVFQGADGKYYKPVGTPLGVYEKVNQDGTSLAPPQYVYSPNGSPGGGGDKAAYPDGAGGYYVENPAGSNIFKKVAPDGTLTDSPAVWGGKDKTFGTSDDQPVELVPDGSGSPTYWRNMGQNVWRQTSGTTQGPLTGGGVGKNPATAMAQPVEKVGGQYFLGPIGSDGNGNQLYYGDPAGGNKLLESDASGPAGDDVLYYKDPNGNMVPVGSALIKGGDGKWYRSAGRPGVFEIVNPDGSSKVPPAYVYNPNGTPGGGGDMPALPDGNGGFFVEDPAGSNIYKEVGDDGALTDSPAVWGGNDKTFGTGDDMPALSDGSGNYYVEDPAGSNIFKKVGGDGALTDSPAVWGGNDKTFGTGDDMPALSAGGGKYYAEDPAGSNIYKEVGGDGALKDSPAVWGGGDLIFGTDDDMPVTRFDDGAGNGSYWYDMGQNVWRGVDDPEYLGPLTGGGANKNPAANKVRPIIEVDGRYYVDTVNTDPNGNNIYYGDKMTGGNGALDSSATGTAGDDVVYYMDGDGNMTTTPPIGVDIPKVAIAGRILTDAQTGDGNWVEIATSGGYSLIVRQDVIPGQTNFSAGEAGVYSNSYARNQVNSWFSKLSSSARLKQFTVGNDAMKKIGPANNIANSGFSKPNGVLAPSGNDVAFLLSSSEAIAFASKDWWPNNDRSYQSSAEARANFARLNAAKDRLEWLRTPGDMEHEEAGMNYESLGRMHGIDKDDPAFNRPALWVNSNIFG